MEASRNDIPKKSKTSLSPPHKKEEIGQSPCTVYIIEILLRISLFMSTKDKWTRSISHNYHMELKWSWLSHGVEMINCRKRRTLDDLGSWMIISWISVLGWSWILDLGWSLIRGPRRRGGVSQACLGHPCAPFDFVYQSWHHFKVMMMMLVMMLMVMLMLIMVVMKCQPRYLAVSQAAPSRRTVGRRTGTKIIFSNNYNWYYPWDDDEVEADDEVDNDNLSQCPQLTLDQNPSRGSEEWARQEP